MLAHRLIPYFLLEGNRLVKGTCFKDRVDIGDPISQALIYDAQGAEEIVLVDILATSQNRIIDLNIISELARKCRLPITVGGGIQRLEDARNCFQSGADKIIVNTSAVIQPQFIKELSDEFGCANVVVALDVKKNSLGKYDIFIKSGTIKYETELFTLITQLLYNGAGEIVITSINQEGTLSGFDFNLYKTLRRIVPIPLIACGGAGCYEDIVDIFRDCKCDGVALGKMLFLRDYDIVRIKSYLKGNHVLVRDT